MDLFYKENNVGSSPIAATILLQVFPEGNKFKSFTEYQIYCGVSEVWLSGWPHKPMPCASWVQIPPPLPSYGS